MRTLSAVLMILMVATTPAWGQVGSTAQVEVEQPVSDSLLPTGQVIAPAGKLVSFHGRPVDLHLAPKGNLLFVKDWGSLRIIDTDSMEIVQSVESPGGASLHGLVVDSAGNVYFTNSKNGLHVFTQLDNSGDGAEQWQLDHSVELPPDSFPCGVAISAKSNTAYVCLSKKNSVAEIDLANRQLVRTFDVGVAPFDVELSGSHLVVTNIGGRRANEADQTAPSAGTPVVVDRRGIASTGSVSIVDVASGNQIRSIAVGRHPSTLAQLAGESKIAVCNTNDDSICILDPQRDSIQTHIVKPAKDIPFGSMPSSVAVVDSRSLMLVALAGNNAVAVFDFDSHKAKSKPRLRGLVPTAWYPVALAVGERDLFVACVKGVGARSRQRPEAEGRNSHDHLGTIQKIPLAEISDDARLRQWTDQVMADSKILDKIDRRTGDSAERDAKPIPVPNRLGDPSVFRHVIYVIKENRTFDQVFGDVVEARSEPRLCIFPEKVTPNHHALARRFGILDNYYCNGVLSADGHSWATEANVTPYLERAFGGFARSYTFGDDPITYSSSGFIWDQVLDAGLSFRNYGEFDYAKPPAGMKYQEIWQAYTANKPIEFEQNIGIERLRRYSCREYPGWNMVIPDVLRMDRYLKEFRKFEVDGNLPALSIVYLPQDHLGGGVTSRAHMADNDLALGRLVEAVSNSRFWKNTVIFVNEDDPQNGYDHIDGHRSLCLVISPWSRRGVNHSFYNQASVVRTILHCLGLPPMNQQDASAPLMTGCFSATPNFEPYKCIDANFSLNETPLESSTQSQLERRWRRVLATVPIERTGMKTEDDEDNLNRFVWHEMKGWQTPYPQQFAGAHGTGLATLGLVYEEDQYKPAETPGK